MLRIVKRGEFSRRRSVLTRIAGIVLALVAAGLFIWMLGHNPFEVYDAMFRGALAKPFRLRQTIVKAIPLVITSIGIAWAFRMKFWNIGAEGQIMMGAFGSALIVRYLPGMPQGVMIPLMALTAFVIAGLWGAIPAFYRAVFKTNETIFTLMMNYLALQWIIFLQYYAWKDPSALNFPKIANFPAEAVLPRMFGIHVGWIFALLLVVTSWFFIHRSKRGFEICVIGESENTARYSGMNVKRIIVHTMFMSGGVCGLAGMIQASGVDGTISKNISGGIGYTAIITAWLAGLSSPVILVVCFLFAVMIQGGSYIESQFQIPKAAAELIQAMILFFVLGSEFFVRYRLIRVTKGEEVADA